MFLLWSAAIQAAAVEHPGAKEFLAVARVLHGHTWVLKLETNTTQLISQVESDMFELCPDLGELLMQLLTVCTLYHHYGHMEESKLSFF